MRVETGCILLLAFFSYIASVNLGCILNNSKIETLERRLSGNIFRRVGEKCKLFLDSQYVDNKDHHSKCNLNKNIFYLQVFLGLNVCILVFLLFYTVCKTDSIV